MKRRGKKIISTVLVVIMALSMFNYSGHPEKTVEAAGSFPVSGVHKGTLTHGDCYMKITSINPKERWYKYNKKEDINDNL